MSDIWSARALPANPNSSEQHTTSGFLLNDIPSSSAVNPGGAVAMSSHAVFAAPLSARSSAARAWREIDDDQEAKDRTLLSRLERTKKTDAELTFFARAKPALSLARILRSTVATCDAAAAELCSDHARTARRR
jgi:hypothetical protein